LDRLGGDEELMRKIIKVFLEDAQQQVNKLAEALAVADSAQVSRLAHKLRGASGSIGATALQGVASKLEVAAQEQATDGFAVSVAPLRQTFEALKRVLERELPAEEAPTGVQPEPRQALNSTKRDCPQAVV
jgi:HPt (histidine-containing phosphotransfer) domain-containing protein